MKNEIYSKIIDISERRIELTDYSFVRDMYKDMEWKSRMILLKGGRGVGKTYMMLQYLKENKGKSIYMSLDHLFFLTNTLSDTIDYLYKIGIRYIGLDEVHLYPSWSLELKNIYDSYTDIQLIVTSSSALDIMSGKGDLSRRLDEYTMRGLSFVEYMRFEYKITLPEFTWEELITRHIDVYEEYYNTLDLGRKFSFYLKKGYYPYYREAGNKYHERLLAVIMRVIDRDLTAIFNIDYESTRQIKKLLALIARIVPFSPNVSKLSRDLSMSRHSILHYLDFMSEAGILNSLKSENKSDSVLTKPDKVYFENTNLLYAFDVANVNSGTMRETFVMNALHTAGEVSTPVKGDFMMNKKYIIEVGGPSKNFSQISGMPNTILVKEGIAKGATDILPMWSLGLLKRKV